MFDISHARFAAEISYSVEYKVTSTHVTNEKPYIGKLYDLYLITCYFVRS